MNIHEKMQNLVSLGYGKKKTLVGLPARSARVKVNCMTLVVNEPMMKDAPIMKPLTETTVRVPNMASSGAARGPAYQRKAGVVSFHDTKHCNIPATSGFGAEGLRRRPDAENKCANSLMSMNVKCVFLVRQ